MRIGELSRRCGVSVRMLRYYESEGLLAPARTRNGYRDYDAAAEETVRRIRLFGTAGLTLTTIRQLLPCVRSGQPEFEPCDELRAILRRQVDELDGRIDALAQSRRILGGFLRDVAEGNVQSRASRTR